MAFLNLILIVVSSLIFPGIIIMTKARLCGRKGPGLFQPLLDVIRLFQKGSVYSRTSSLIFQIAPLVYGASVLVALLFIPFGQYKGFLAFEGDFLFFAYILAIGKFLMIIGAMDTGSGFEGMGANREALYSMLVEPAFFILMGSLALLTDHTSFHDIFVHLNVNSYLPLLIVVVSINLLLQISLVENSRLPVDDPTTHLELTMVHEVMVLDTSGFDLAIIQMATWLKFAIYGSLIANFVIPVTDNLSEQTGIFILVQILFALAIGILESFRARNKMARNPQWILTLSAISLIVFLTSLVFAHKFITTGL